MAPTPRIAVLGGCGHVGLPLALRFASKGCDVTIVYHHGRGGLLK